jgi:hypothetical protein
MDLAAGKWAIPVSTQTFITFWTGLKKTYDMMIRRTGLKKMYLNLKETKFYRA